MSSLHLEFDDLADLRAQLVRFGSHESVPLTPTGSIALFSTAELLVELSRRDDLPIQYPSTGNGEAQGADSHPEPTPPEAEAEAPKKKKQNPRKMQDERKAATMAELPHGTPGEEPPTAKGTPKEPDTNSASPAPSLPTEDDMLALMSEVYSKSGDMELVRSVMQEVGGKTQLSQINVALWPMLQKRLFAERDRLAVAAK
jgi:hypothetical protein